MKLAYELGFTFLLNNILGYCIKMTYIMYEYFQYLSKMSLLSLVRSF